MKNREASLPVISLKEEKAFIKGKVYGNNPDSNSRVRIAYQNPIMNEPEAFVADISENVILVNYWSMGCLPCHTAIEYIEPLKKNYKDKKLVYIYLTDDNFFIPILGKSIRSD